MKRPALQNQRVAVLGMAFRARMVFGTFEKQAPGLNGDSNPDFFNAGAVLHQLSYQANWERSFCGSIMSRRWWKKMSFAVASHCCWLAQKVLSSFMIVGYCPSIHLAISLLDWSVNRRHFGWRWISEIMEQLQAKDKTHWLYITEQKVLRENPTFLR